MNKQDKNKARMDELWARVEEERGSLQTACLRLAKYATAAATSWHADLNLVSGRARPSKDLDSILGEVRNAEHELFIAESKVAWTAERIRKEEAGE